VLDGIVFGDSENTTGDTDIVTKVHHTFLYTVSSADRVVIKRGGTGRKTGRREKQFERRPDWECQAGDLPPSFKDSADPRDPLIGHCESCIFRPSQPIISKTLRGMVRHCRYLTGQPPCIINTFDRLLRILRDPLLDTS